MTDEKRYMALHALIRKYTAENTVSKSAARKALIREGIYTSKGKLRAEFGGEPSNED